MNDYSVKKILAQKKGIRLPECTYCSIRCWECRYFETDAPDSKGQCRCSYRGRWYYPHEGCGNGKTWNPHPQPTPNQDPEPRPKPIPKPEPRPDPIPNPERSSGGMGIIFLVVAGIAILFSLGIIKPTITFEMNGVQGQSTQHTVYSLNAVRMDDGSNHYPKNFSAYTVESEAFNEYGKTSIDLKKGGYDIWISHDGVSGFAGNVDVNNAFDKTVSVNPENVQNGSMRMAMIYLQDQSHNAVATENLLITDNNGNKISCTSYKEDGCYILVIPDSQMTQSVIAVTVQADGFEKCGLELDFSQGRTVDGKVMLTSK